MVFDDGIHVIETEGHVVPSPVYIYNDVTDLHGRTFVTSLHHFTALQGIALSERKKKQDDHKKQGLPSIDVHLEMLVGRTDTDC